MESVVLCRNVHIGLRQGQGPGPIISYCANAVSFTGPAPGPVLCDCTVSSSGGSLYLVSCFCFFLSHVKTNTTPPPQFLDVPLAIL